VVVVDMVVMIMITIMPAAAAAALCTPRDVLVVAVMGLMLRVVVRRPSAVSTSARAAL
jgi:hypothetical protein